MPEMSIASEFVKGVISSDAHCASLRKQMRWQCMKKRTIMIFPKFENMEHIDKLRKKHDPLENKVRPHITLVFPFESELSRGEILEIFERRLSEVEPFTIRLHGLSTAGRWLFLNLTQGADDVTRIHEALYGCDFLEYKPVWLNKYTPHITVGVFDSPEEAQIVCEAEKDFEHIFTCVVDRVSVEIIGCDEESIIEAEYVFQTKE